MKISSIVIEGMHNVDTKEYTFDSVNYIVGPNGAGKSTILQAIQLGLLGYIPGTAKRTSAIFQHCNKDRMSITLRLDTGASIYRTWIKAKSTIASDVEVRPEDQDIDSIIKDIELPLFNFNEFSSMTANKLKDWFIDFMPNSSDSFKLESVVAELAAKYPKSDVPIMAIIEKDKRRFSDDVDGVRALNAEAKSRTADEKRRQERNMNMAQMLVYHGDVDADLDVEDIDKKLRVAQLELEGLTEYSRVAESNARVREALTTIDSQIASLQYDEAKVAERMRAITEYKEGCRAKSAELAERVNIRRSNIVEHRKIISGGGICPYTATSCESISAMCEKFKQEDEELRKEIETINAEIATIDGSRYDAEERELTALCDEYRRLLQKRSMYEDQLKPEIAPLDSSRTIEDVRNDIAQLTNLKAKVLANLQYEKLIDTVTEERFLCEANIELLKALATRTSENGLQTDLSVKQFESFSNDMSTMIKQLFGSTSTAKFYVTNAANSFSFGLERDGAYIPYDLLSSGEKCLYMITMMTHIAKSSESPLNVVIVDDMLDHLDDKNIQKLFTTLKTVEDVQYVFAGVVPVTHSKDVNKYNVIEVK